MLEMIFAGISAGSSVLNGINNGKSAKKIGKIQRETAAIQYEYNKKQVKEATEMNIRGALKQYVSARESLYEQKEKVRMGINFTSQMKGTEKEDNSYMKDSRTKLESEFQENLRATLENQKNDLFNIEKQGIDQNYNVMGDYNSALSNINQTQIKAQQEAQRMVTDGIMKLGAMGMKALQSSDKFGSFFSKAESAPSRFEQSFNWARSRSSALQMGNRMRIGG